MGSALAASNGAAQIDAAGPRKHDIQDEKIDRRCGKRIPHLVSRTDTADPKAVTLQGTLEKRAHAGIIFDNEDTGGEI
ncbi:hypothetical protein KBA01_01320 [Kozakia baliensis]|nr:hypothetical protein KBA01_01320 [Kozakia baliensis]